MDALRPYLRGPRVPRPALALVQGGGARQADENQIGKQRIEQLLALEQAREAAGANDDRRLAGERLRRGSPASIR